MFFNVFFIKLKKTCFYVFYLQINVFNIYDFSILNVETFPGPITIYYEAE